jgi:hypothetical protein
VERGSDLRKWKIACVGVFWLQLLFVQCTQACYRALGSLEISSKGTILSVRFLGLLLVALIWAAGTAWKNRSLAVFHPGDVRRQARRAGAQTLQAGFIMGAAREVSGAMQGAISVVTVPLFLNIVETWRHYKRGGEPVGRWRWFGPAAYAVVATLLASNAEVSGGSLPLGMGFMCGSGIATAFLFFWARDASAEPLATSLLWQNGPVALVTLVLWTAPKWLPPQLHAALPVHHVALGTTLLFSMVALQTLEQVALIQTTRFAELAGIPNTQFSAWRGGQVWIGAALDWWGFNHPPSPRSWVAFAAIAVAIPISWFTAAPGRK